MAKAKAHGHFGSGSGSRRRPTEFNLEKPPLRTGEPLPDVSLRTRAAMGADFWAVIRRMAALVALIVVAIYLLMGTSLIPALTRFFEQFYRTD